MVHRLRRPHVLALQALRLLVGQDNSGGTLF